MEYTIDFDHPLIGRQKIGFDIDPDVFAGHIAKARTFGFLREVELMHKNGLALGGSLDNAVVLDEYGVVNEGGLRFDDEFVRHKVLDFIGDMAVAPLPLMGKFEVSCSGHAFNNEFLRLLVDNEATCLRTVTMAAPAMAPRQGRPRGRARGPGPRPSPRRRERAFRARPPAGAGLVFWGGPGRGPGRVPGRVHI